MTANIAAFDDGKDPDPEARTFSALRRFRLAATVFVVSSILLLAGMSVRPSVYDEGITVTGAMRVLNGQLPHRDFYTNYGPAHFYILAGFFKIFGETLLVERVLYTCICGLIVASVFAISSMYCSMRVVFWITLTIAFWLFGLGAVSGYSPYPVSLLSLIAAALLVPVFAQQISISRALVIGVLAGLSSLIRYDAGIGLLGVEVCVIAFAAYARPAGLLASFKTLLVAVGATLGGFAIPVIPALLYYESRAPFHFFYADIVVYSSKYYARARSLPFPAIHLKTLFDIAIYLPILIAVMAILVAVAGILKIRREIDSDSIDLRRRQLTSGFLFVFGVLGLVMYFKGIVRVSVVQMYLSILPSLFSIGLLYDLRFSFRRPITFLVRCLFLLSVFAGMFQAIVQVYHFHLQHNWVPAAIVAEISGTLPPEEEAWCKVPGPLTRGICFIPEPDRIKAVEFIDSHTSPGQKLFVGAGRHDRIFANDNITYFAAQRMPVTHWQHFDPFLQDTAGVQLQMIQELETNKTPYIMLDSEFDNIHEPNESDRNTGVLLFDNYIRQKYVRVETFGDLSIWQRMQP